MKLLEIPKVLANAEARNNAALIGACFKGLKKVAMKLLERPEVLANAEADNNAALRWACLKGLEEVAMKLLKRPEVLANAEARNNAALICACQHGMSGVAMKLLKNKKVLANAEARNNAAFKGACLRGLEKVAMELLKNQKVLANAEDDNNAALINACAKGMEKVAMELLAQPKVLANAEAENNAALMNACGKGMEKVALKLLERPEVLANAEARNNAVLRNACAKGLEEVAMKLLEIPKVLANAEARNNAVLRNACAKGLEEVAMKLLEIPKVLANAEANNNFALRYACQNGMSKVALKLLEMPKVLANAEARNNAALINACAKGLEKVAMKLLEKPEVLANAEAGDNSALRSVYLKDGMEKVLIKLLSQPKVFKADYYVRVYASVCLTLLLHFYGGALLFWATGVNLNFRPLLFWTIGVISALKIVFQNTMDFYRSKIKDLPKTNYEILLGRLKIISRDGKGIKNFMNSLLIVVLGVIASSLHIVTSLTSWRALFSFPKLKVAQEIWVMLLGGHYGAGQLMLAGLGGAVTFVATIPLLYGVFAVSEVGAKQSKKKESAISILGYIKKALVGVEKWCVALVNIMVVIMFIGIIPTSLVVPVEPFYLAIQTIISLVSLPSVYYYSGYRVLFNRNHNNDCRPILDLKGLTNDILGAVKSWIKAGEVMIHSIYKPVSRENLKNKAEVRASVKKSTWFDRVTDFVPRLFI